MPGDAPTRADFSCLRYAQVWEDADVLLEALDVRPGDACVSIASAGDNALALLTRNPSRVIAIDVSVPQIACLELRVAAYRVLAHGELLELVGSRASTRRATLYARCRPALSSASRAIWDGRQNAIEQGIGGAGKFERYFSVFRNYILPLVHARPVVDALLETRSAEDRRRFYATHWDTWRWRLLFKLFFSRTAMGWLGRDREFFRYVDGDVAAPILERTRHALIELDPALNPYIHWILKGTHGAVLPYALREEHFETIRANLDRLTIERISVEEFVDREPGAAFDRFNLSDLFEYVSLEHYHRLLASIVRASRKGARLAYWNMLASRHRPDHMADRLVPLAFLADRLHAVDRGFFYSALRVEEVR